MYKGYRITTVLPAYDEANHIGQVINTLPDFVDHIIVVDDCSTDGTREAALANGDSRLLALTTGQNQGVGGATILGYRKAIELRSDIIIKMDGDGQMDPAYLSYLIDPLIDQGYDYAKGNRFLAGESLAAMPKHRLIGNMVLTFLTKMASGYWHIFDPQNGYTAIKSVALCVLDLNLVHKRYFFENDMLIHLNLFGFRVKDVAIPARYGTEKSNLDVINVSSTFPFSFATKVLSSHLSEVCAKGLFAHRTVSISGVDSILLGSRVWDLPVDRERYYRDCHTNGNDHAGAATTHPGFPVALTGDRPGHSRNTEIKTIACPG